MGQETIASEVRRAMEEHELRAYYQPKYDADTNRMVGAEALVRWIKKDGTFVVPGQFIPQLEDTMDITAVDWYILEEVCAFLKKQRDSGQQSVPIAVNFSRMHIYETDFVSRLCQTVDRYGLPYSLIEIEITESAFTVSTDRLISYIQRIHEAGFRIAIDDFGSGLSSLSMIKDVSADVLKIDKSLLDGNCESEKERIVLESIFSFAHRLRLTTVAEGVETKEQLSFLRTCSCEIIQGYLFAKPMPEAEFAKLFSDRENIEASDDILTVQAPSRAVQLLLEAVFMRFPLIIFSNLTKNSYYMMSYENFTSTHCASTGVFDELIVDGAASMHPDDADRFRETFDRQHLLALHAAGEKTVKLVTRQLGNDGTYRSVETTDYFVKNPSAEDVLVITLAENV